MKKPLLLFLLAMLCAPAFAQVNDSLVVLFLSEPGVRPARIFADGFESGDLSRLDFNGDDTPDLVMVREDELGNPRDILVVEASSLDTLWRVNDVGTTLGLNDFAPLSFLGFADADADGSREAVFAGESDVVLIEPRSNTQNWSVSFTPPTAPIRVIGIDDITESGSEEISIGLMGSRQVQVWTANK